MFSTVHYSSLIFLISPLSSSFLKYLPLLIICNTISVATSLMSLASANVEASLDLVRGFHHFSNSHSFCRLGSGNFFCKGPDCKYFRLCGPLMVSVTCSCLFFLYKDKKPSYLTGHTKSSPRQDVTSWL